MKLKIIVNNGIIISEFERLAYVCHMYMYYWLEKRKYNENSSIVRYC